MRLSAAVTGLLLAVTTAACAQDAVLLRLGGRVGQSDRSRTVMETFMRPGGQMASMMSSDTTLPFMRMTMYMTRTLNAVSGDTLTIVEVIDSAAMETPAAPQMAGMMGAMAGQMRGQTTTQRGDGRGRIFSSEVSGGMAAMAGMGGMGGPGRGGRGGRGGPGGAMGPGGNERPLFLLPARSVRVGETWTDTMVTPGESPSTFAATYTLARLEQRGGARIAVITVNGTQTTAGQQGPQTFNVSGEYQLDVSGSRMVGASMTMSGTVQSREGTMPVRMQLTQSTMP